MKNVESIQRIGVTKLSLLAKLLRLTLSSREEIETKNPTSEQVGKSLKKTAYITFIIT